MMMSKICDNYNNAFLSREISVHIKILCCTNQSKKIKNETAQKVSELVALLSSETQLLLLKD